MIIGKDPQDIKQKFIGVFTIVIGAFGVSLSTFFTYRSIASKAAAPTRKIVQAALSHGRPGDWVSDVVLGHVNFNQAGPNQVVPYKVFNPGGVVVDRNRRPNTVYVYDGGNSRILVYTSLGTCTNDASKTCTTNSDCPTSTCTPTINKPADFFIGQPSGIGYSACNQDSNMQNYPYRSPATASTMCTMPEALNSLSEGGSFASMAVDSQHNFYVTDFYNNRVLKFLDPVTTDRIADVVWGQAGFSGNRCNLVDSDLATGDAPAPTASSLCMGRNGQFQISFMAGVDIDPQGNLWVADSSNHRVLRFPVDGIGTIAKTADLVLGQPTFTTRVAGSALTNMNQPALVRVHPQSGEVYVADYANHRILVFTPPFANGMNASRTFGSGLKYPAGLEFDPSGNGIWISDYGNFMLERWNATGSAVINVLFKDSYQPNGACGPMNLNVTCINPRPDGSCWYNMCGALGSIGIDSDSNLLVSSSSFNQDVWRFRAPIPTPVTGRVISADHRLFAPPEGSNLFSRYGMFSPRGIVVSDNQLIVSDGYRLLFWNDPINVTNGKPADGYAGVSSFQNKDIWSIDRIAADNNHRLWVVHNSNIDVYALPLTSGAKPIKTAISYTTGLPVLGGGTVTWPFGNQFWGIDVDPSGNYLWLTQVEPYNRVLRVRNPFTNPMVDVILGQINTTDTACNRNLSSAQLDTVCYPGAVTLDRQGNVWVSDHSLEFHGNNRLLFFDKSLFFSITNTARFAPPATFASPTVYAWEPAFSSDNTMVVGYNGQLTLGFPGVYRNPIQTLRTSVTPDTKLLDYFSHGYSAAFDDLDNLYIADLNRGRVLVYKTPLANYCAGADGTSCTYMSCTSCTGRLCPKNPCREVVGVCNNHVCGP